MNFPVLSDEQIKAQRGTIEPGECDFEILKVEEKTAKKSLRFPLRLCAYA